MTSGGHGAAAWTMLRVDDTSYFAFTSSGSARSRLNCVGTMWLWVTLYLSISSSMPSGVHLSMRITRWPRCSELPVKCSTAVWYSGEPVQCTPSPSGVMPNIWGKPANSSPNTSGSMSTTGRFTPLGLPVVPDV